MKYSYTIDGWVNAPNIRQHFLIVLSMVLIAVVGAISFATSRWASSSLAK